MCGVGYQLLPAGKVCDSEGQQTNCGEYDTGVDDGGEGCSHWIKGSANIKLDNYIMGLS